MFLWFPRVVWMKDGLSPVERQICFVDGFRLLATEFFSQVNLRAASSSFIGIGRDSRSAWVTGDILFSKNNSVISLG